MPSSLRRALTSRSVVVIVLAAGLACSCAARRFDRLMRDWEGRPLSQLLTTWGAPLAVFSDGNGGHVVAYVPTADAQTTGEGRVTSGPHLANDILEAPGTRPVYAPRVSAGWPVYRLFFVDSLGRIYEARWKGEWVCCDM